MAGVRGKKNRRVEIDSRGNITSGMQNGQPFIAINGDSSPTEVNGKLLAGRTGNSMHAHNTKMEIIGPLMRVRFDMQIGSSKKFPRAVTKIALEAVAYFHGAKAALAEHLNNARNYVMHGGDVRPVLLTHPMTPDGYTQIPPPALHACGYVGYFQIARIGFFVDMSPDQEVLGELVRSCIQTGETSVGSVIPPSAVERLIAHKHQQR